MLVSPVDANVSVYSVPIVPLTTRFEKVATPDALVEAVAADTLAPAEIVANTLMFCVLTTLLPESTKRTAGDVPTLDPLDAPSTNTTLANLVAGPVVTFTVLVATGKLFTSNVSVYV